MSLETLPPQVEYRPPGPPWWVKAILSVLAVAGGLLATYLGAQWLAGLANPTEESVTIEPGVAVEVVIPDGASARRISTILAESGVVVSADDFEDEVADRGIASRLRAGTYQLETVMNVDELFVELTDGPPPAPTVRVTVVEGLRLEEMLNRLADGFDHLDVDDFRRALLSGRVESPYLPEELPEDVPPENAYEGLLFPDTYEFLADASAETVLQRMADTLVDRFQTLDTSALDALGIDRYEAMIIASLIEEEAKIAEDRPLIASVVYNRLDIGMALQIDATVIYALGENPGRVLQSDLEIDSPYNTYQITGLPPTPIAGFRIASLEAALNPADTEFLYYVLVDESGAHGFTADYDEFLRLKAQAQQDGVFP